MCGVFRLILFQKIEKKLNFKKRISSKSLYHDNHPKFNAGAGYLDFLEIRKKIFFTINF